VKQVKTAELSGGKIVFQAVFENNQLSHLDILLGKGKSGKIDSGEVEQLTNWLVDTVLNDTVITRNAAKSLSQNIKVPTGPLPQATIGDPFENRKASSKMDDLSPIEREERELMGAGQPEMIDNSKNLTEVIKISIPKGFKPK